MWEQHTTLGRREPGKWAEIKKTGRVLKTKIWSRHPLRPTQQPENPRNLFYKYQTVRKWRNSPPAKTVVSNKHANALYQKY